MSLFTDGNVSTLEHLRAYESSVFDVAAAEGIDLSGKLDLATQETSVELASFLADSGGPIRGLEHIVVTPALRQWHALHTLATVYRDAYHNQLNDRYNAKARAFGRAAQDAFARLLDTGIGVVDTPIARPTKPVVDYVPGGCPAATYYVSTSWVGSNSEGCASEALAYEVSAGNTLMVRVSAAPANATGWNVYAGLDAESMARQNDTTLGAHDPWIMPETGLVAGTTPGHGQRPDRFVTALRRLRRG